MPADNTKLPRMRAIDADWRLGVAATGLDRANRQVLLANGEKVPYDRLLIATGRPRAAVVQRRRGQAGGSVHAAHLR